MQSVQFLFCKPHKQAEKQSNLEWEGALKQTFFAIKQKFPNVPGEKKFRLSYQINLALPHHSCFILGKLSKLYFFPHIQDANKNNTYFIKVLSVLNEKKHKDLYIVSRQYIY